MKKIIIYINSDNFFQLFYNIAMNIEQFGFEVIFWGFTFRERKLIRKNNLNIFPKVDYLYDVKDVTDPLSQSEIDEVLDFALRKSKASKEMLRKRASILAKTIASALNSEFPEAIFVWNGEDLVAKIIQLFATRHNIKIIFFENGYLPNTLQIDNEGVNFRHSVSRKSFQEIENEYVNGKNYQDIVNSDKIRIVRFSPLTFVDKLFCFLHRKFNRHYYLFFPELKGDTFFTDMLLYFIKKLIKRDNIYLPDQFVFLPLQVHDDTQIILNSYNFKNMYDFVEFSCMLIEKIWGKNMRIVVKEHPEDLGRISYHFLKKKHKSVFWIRKLDPNYILSKCSVVFTINSSMGFQALEQGKPIVVFGNSLYGKDEVACIVRDLSNISNVIKNVNDGLSQKKLRKINIFVQYMKEFVFVRGSWRKVDVDTVAGVLNKILIMLMRKA